MKINYYILLGLFVFLFSFQSLAQTTNGFNFQAVVDWQELGTRQIDIKITITDGYNTLFEEYHTTECSKDGVCTISIGNGDVTVGALQSVVWSKDDLQFKIYYRAHDNNVWIDGGSSSITPLPQAIFAENIGTKIVKQQSLEASNSGLAITTIENDTAIYISPKGNVTLHTPKDSLAFTVGVGKKLIVSSDEEDGNKKGAISFHWTVVLGSKPAIVGYDENMRQRFAVVAHYWSSSSHRAHQHISFEVDTEESTAINTQFGIPWGNKTSLVQTFSRYVTLHSPGNLYVKNSIDPAILSGTSLLHRQLFVGDTLPERERGEQIIQVYAKSNNSLLHIFQEQGNYPARLLLSNKERDWNLQISTRNNFDITNLSKSSLHLNTSGNVGLVKNNPSEKLDISGNTKASMICSDELAFSIQLELSSEVEEGDLIGYNPTTKELGKYQSNRDNLIGVVSSNGYRVNSKSSTSQYCYPVCTLGQVDINQDQIQIIGGLVYTLDNKLIGVLLSNQKIYIREF